MARRSPVLFPESIPAVLLPLRQRIQGLFPSCKKLVLNMMLDVGEPAHPLALVSFQNVVPSQIFMVVKLYNAIIIYILFAFSSLFLFWGVDKGLHFCS